MTEDRDLDEARRDKISARMEAQEILTSAMLDALDIAVDFGAAVAGAQADPRVSYRGSLLRIHASALRALERRGYVTLHISPDGRKMARPTEAGILKR